MINKDCIINGVTYHPELRGYPRYSFAWDKGLSIFSVRLTQFPNIFYLRITKIGWKWPLIRSVEVWENPDNINKE
jgi:hypothetical protein